MVSSTSDRLYLDLLKRCLTRIAFGEKYRRIDPAIGTVKRTLYYPLRNLLELFRLELVCQVDFNFKSCAEGRNNWPANAETMIGMYRLDNIETCVTHVIRNQVPGDLLEAGVWRGGACILMRGVLKALGETSRTVWVADSFEGLPKPDLEKYPIDSGDVLWKSTQLAISVDEVKANFARYELLDDRVKFIKGWFKDTLPAAPIDKLALLRLDTDMYGSTMDVLRALYHKVSVGGFILVDDYFALPNCRSAVDDFRTAFGITDELKQIDWNSGYWQKTAS